MCANFWATLYSTWLANSWPPRHQFVISQDLTSAVSFHRDPLRIGDSIMTDTNQDGHKQWPWRRTATSMMSTMTINSVKFIQRCFMSLTVHLALVFSRFHCYCRHSTYNVGPANCPVQLAHLRSNGSMPVYIRVTACIAWYRSFHIP